MCLRTGTDHLVGPEGWKVKGGLLQDNIKVDLERMEGFGERTGLMCLRIETGVVLL